MKHLLCISLVVPLLILLMVPNAASQPVVGVDEGPGEALIYTPADIEWRDGPGSFEAGSQYAILEGNPGEEGLFTMYIRMPHGFHIAPHWHPNVERVTVISGTFLLGHGRVADRGAAQRLEAGSYFSLPPEMTHFAFTEGETVVQLKSIGPWVIEYVNPADDPRLRD